MSQLVSEALHTAKHANTRAQTALARVKNVEQGPEMHYVSKDVSVAPQTFQKATLACPQGFLVAGSAMINGAIIDIAQADAASAVQFDGYNPSSSQSFSYTAEVNCVHSRHFHETVGTAASANRAIARAEAQFRAALHVTHR